VVAGDVLAGVAWGAARAKALARARRVEEAERLARETVALADETDALNMRADVRLALAAVLREGERHDAAASAVSEALALYRAKGNVVAAARTERLLADWQPVTSAASPGAPRARGRPRA
jgi:hypothetical protein